MDRWQDDRNEEEKFFVHGNILRDNYNSISNNTLFQQAIKIHNAVSHMFDEKFDLDYHYY